MKLKALTNDEFIKKCKEIHKDDDYDYSITKYISRVKTPYIEYYCNIHKKIIRQLVSNHLKGCGCDECGKEKCIRRKSFEEFEKECKEKYGNEYDYSYSKKDYKDTKSYIDIKHNYCGLIFNQLASNHLYSGNGCPYCYGKENLTTEEFIKRSKEIFGSSLDYSKTKYINMTTPVILKCNECGLEFKKIPSNHLGQKQGCPKESKKYKRTTEELIKELEEKNDNFDYSKVKFKNVKTKVTVVCKNCKKEYKVNVENLLRGHGCSCTKKYIGEERILKFLNKQNIKNERRKEYENLIDKRKLNYDFYLSDFNLLIEYNGIQHYESVEYFGGEERLKIQQKHDKIKEEYAKNNNINLLVIPYTDFNNIEKILGDEIENIKNRS